MSRIEVLGNPGNSSNSKSEILFHNLLEGKVDTEEDAMNLLYEDLDERANFKRFLNRFKQKLINTLFFIDLNSPIFEDYNKAYYNGYKYLAAIRILTGRAAKFSAVEIAEKYLPKLIKYEYTELIFQFARFLTRYYLLSNANEKKYKYYHEISSKYREVWLMEQEAEDLFAAVGKFFVNTRATDPKLISFATKISKEVRPYLERYQTHQLVYYAHTIFLVESELKNDNEASVMHCEAALGFLDKKPFKHKSIMVNFARPLISNLVKIGNYKRASEIASKYVKISKGQPYHSLLLIHVFALRIHTGEYNKAYDIYQSVISSEDFKFKSKAHQESWRIYGAYVYFLIQLGKIDPLKSGEKPVLKDFKIGKFLNETPTFSKDKRGGNIAIIIIQVLLFLQRKEYSKYIDRTDALIRYSSRYLKKDENYRSNCLINMLATIPNGNFHRAAVERHSKKYHNKLLLMPRPQSPQSPDLEFFPYEKLWEFALELLDPVPS